jgi:UDP-3-O-[3-hydroxymyristoyl] glucosamine N-acyltransferase
MNISFKIEALADQPYFKSGRFIGDKNSLINDVIGIRESQGSEHSNHLSWVNENNASLINQSLKLGLLILSESSYEILKSHSCNFLVVENPRLVFQKILKKYFSQKKQGKIEPSAVVDTTVKIPSGTYIGHNVVIEENCSIGNDCEIMHNTVILKNTVIGDRVRIGSNCTIGNFGFGYEKNELGDFELIEHLGKVIIKNDVHIHNNTCIDRGVLGTTSIGENVKIDNLVHIAHGVHIERNSMIIAHAMVAGSVKIGEDCWIAPSTSIKNQLTIAKGTLTGIAAVVLKNSEVNDVLIGSPATTMADYKKWSQFKKKLLEQNNI